MIVLVGFMGAGKTTVGRLLADKLGLPFVDSDLVIERRAGRPVRRIFAEDGEDAFRAVEHETVKELLAGRDAVLAVGGGAVEHVGTRRLLGAATVVYLQVGYDEAMLRVGGDGDRPMLRAADVAGLYRRRLAAYRAVATLTVPTGGRRPEAICLDVLDRLTSVPSQRT